MTGQQHTPPDSDPEDHQVVVSRRSGSENQRSSVSSQSRKMLSINFSTPLAGAARSERIKQMTNNHPAFAKARVSQEILVKIQTSLRRMPGVSSNESSEIISQLQEVGQIISQETSQLVDALMHVTLDSEDTDKAIARMSIEANLAKARIEDQAQTISDLRDELDKENKKREVAEEEVRKVMNDLQELTQEFKSWKEKEGITGDNVYSDRDDLIKHLEETIKHLEGQVNNRRSLWAVKHPDPRQIAHVIKTLTDSCADKEVIQQTIMSLAADAGENELHVPKNMSRAFNDMSLQQERPQTAFQPNRPASAAPPKYGPLQSGPPRAPPTMPRVQSPWNANGPGQGRFPYAANGPWASPGVPRAPSRRGFQQNGTYRPTAPEFYPSSMPPPDRGFQRTDPYGQAGQRKDYYPVSPSMSRGKYGRPQNSVSPEYGISHSSALTSRFPPLGPLIHISEMTVTAWHDQIMQLYSVIRHFVENNANEPTDMAPISLKNTRLWSVLMAVYYPLSENEAVSYLEYHFKDASSKSCLVTRVIVDYIVNRVWIPQAWCGAEEEVSYALVEVERDLERTQGQSSSFRQPILDRQAVLVDAVLKLEHYPQFSKHKVESITEVLMGTIQPLLNENAKSTQAFRDMEIVAEAAWGLSSKILSSRLTFDFRFPEVGIRFSCQSMIPIWPDLDPMELQAKHWRISLVTTPVITCRNDTGANISAHSVALADVICMQ